MEYAICSVIYLVNQHQFAHSVAKTDYSTQTLVKMGKKLKSLRIKAGYGSYETFAFEHELSSRYYWGVEKGRNISMKYLLDLLQIHNLTVEQFFKDLDKV